MTLHPIFPAGIRTAADKLYPLKGSKQMNTETKSITGLSAAQEKALSEVFQALPESARQEVIEKFTTINEVNARTNAEKTRKKVALERINAAKSDVAGGRNAINLLNGTLHRGGLPSVEELAEKSPDEILKLFAGSTMASMDKIACKNTLAKLKVIQ
jgi:hypothetical protein